ncbi:hypothetical protein SASPL_126003 [Salvia splendens]|uniref:Uncharacterized protein n=1 Tax=Salvia splendens TaxID=180675 RepID=A0A8X8ZR92_SALSN|nr:hypothetical protein SASPL_126003 [Salvia splendens]
MFGAMANLWGGRAHFDTLWRAAQEFGVTEYDGIEKLIELLPDSWKEWAKRTARRYTWHEPVTEDMVGDMAGFRKAVYCALVDSREEQPPQDVQERIVKQRLTFFLLMRIWI